MSSSQLNRRTVTHLNSLDQESERGAHRHLKLLWSYTRITRSHWILRFCSVIWQNMWPMLSIIFSCNL